MFVCLNEYQRNARSLHASRIVLLGASMHVYLCAEVDVCLAFLFRFSDFVFIRIISSDTFTVIRKTVKNILYFLLKRTHRWCNQILELSHHQFTHRMYENIQNRSENIFITAWMFKEIVKWYLSINKHKYFTNFIH